MRSRRGCVAAATSADATDVGGCDAGSPTASMERETEGKRGSAPVATLLGKRGSAGGASVRDDGSSGSSLMASEVHHDRLHLVAEWQRALVVHVQVVLELHRLAPIRRIVG